jgi:hypothetical protein
MAVVFVKDKIRRNRKAYSMDQLLRKHVNLQKGSVLVQVLRALRLSGNKKFALVNH